VAVFTRRNALLGWSVVQSNRIRRTVKKVRQADKRRSSTSLIALAVAGIAGTLAFRRRRRGGESPPAPAEDTGEEG